VLILLFIILFVYLYDVGLYILLAIPPQSSSDLVLIPVVMLVSFQKKFELFYLFFFLNVNLEIVSNYFVDLS